MHAKFSSTCLSAHENTLVAVYIFYLRGLIIESNESLSSHKKIKVIIPALVNPNLEILKLPK